MSLRTVLAVALAVAILGVAIPGVERAGEQRTHREVRGDVERLADAGRSLLDRDEVGPSGEPGARRVVTVSIPAGSWYAAELDYLAIGGSPGRSPAGTDTTGVVAYRLAGHPATRLRIPVPLRVASDEPLVVRGPGRHDLWLRLARPDDHRIVYVERAR